MTHGLVALLETLRRPHLVVDEDCWYSCPESGECCDKTLAGCNCDANDFNARLDQAIALVGGFTREDVDELRRLADFEESQQEYHSAEDVAHWLSIADRIEALLPPRETGKP